MNHHIPSIYSSFIKLFFGHMGLVGQERTIWGEDWKCEGLLEKTQR